MPWDEADLPKTLDHPGLSEERRGYKWPCPAHQVRVRKTVLDHCAFICRIFLSVLDQVPFSAALRHLIAPIRSSEKRGAPKGLPRIVILVGSPLVFLAAAYAPGARPICNRSRTRLRANIGSARSRRPFSRTRAIRSISPTSHGAGIGVLASRFGLFSGAGELDFVYRLIFAKKIPARKTQGESYRAYCERSAILARAKAARSVRKSPAGLGAGFRGESFVWIFGLADWLVAITRGH